MTSEAEVRELAVKFIAGEINVLDLHAQLNTPLVLRIEVALDRYWTGYLTHSELVKRFQEILSGDSNITGGKSNA